MTIVATGHVWLDERSVAWLDDTNVKVIEVTLERIAHGSSPEEMYDQHEGYLSFAQIHAAMTYYYDHQDELDAEIERQVAEFDRRRAATLDSPGRQRLRALGRLSNSPTWRIVSSTCRFDGTEREDCRRTAGMC